MKTRSYVSLRARVRSAAPPARRRGAPRATLRADPERRAGSRAAPPARRVALHEHRPRARRARAPRSPARRCRRTGRARRAPRRSPSIENSASRDAVGGRPRGRAPRRAAGACRRGSRRSRASASVIRTGRPPLLGGDRLGASRRACARAPSPSSACSGAPARGRRPGSPRRCARARSSSAASSGRRATRNWPTPDWRVPASSPSLRSSQVDLGQAEAVGVLGQRAQPPSRAALAGPTSRHSSGARRARPGRAAGAAGRSRSARRSRSA